MDANFQATPSESRQLFEGLDLDNLFLKLMASF